MNKGTQTKNFILKKAREVFCVKGYYSVTMKDLCEATGLSRGGLYRHYSSTKEIFLDILTMHKEDSEKQLDQAIASKMPAPALLEAFLREQRREIFARENQITFAVYEFSMHEPDSRELFNTRFEEGIRILTKLLNYGLAEKSLSVSSPSISAKHVILTLEGMKMTRTVTNMQEDEVNEQLAFIRVLLGGNNYE